MPFSTIPCPSAGPRRCRPTRLGLLSPLALTSIVVAQDAPMGAMAAWPIAIVHGIGSGPSSGIAFKLSGDQTQGPIVPPDATSNWIPDYTMGKMFHDAAGNPIPVVIDAMSSGNDRIYYDQTGKVDGNAAGGWAALTVSVTSDALGVNPGPLYDRTSQLIDPSADLYTYYFPDSSGIEDGLLGQVLLEQTRESQGLPPSTDVRAADWWIPIIVANAGSGTAMAPITNKFYFSVTSPCAATLPANFATTPGPYSGATIFSMEWNGATGLWSTPVVFRSPADMNLQFELDIDALAVTPSDGGNDAMIVFSLANGAGASQILALVQDPQAPNGPRVPTPLRDSTGTQVTVRLKLRGTDQVDSLCGTDPDISHFDRFVGTPCEPGTSPVHTLTPTSLMLGISTAREIRNSGLGFRDYLAVKVTGIPVLGPSTSQNVALYLVSHADYSLLYVGSVPVAAGQSRVGFTLGIPTNLVGDWGLVAAAQQAGAQSPVIYSYLSTHRF